MGKRFSSLRFSALLVIGLLCIVAAYLIYKHYTAHEAKQVNIQTRDWGQISFQTQSGARRPNANHYAAKNSAGGGIIAGQTQYMWTSIVGFPAETPYIEGAVNFTAQYVNITIIDITDWITYVDYDNKIGEYFVVFGKENSSPDYELPIYYKPPFDVVPRELDEKVVYSSKSPETLILQSPSGQSDHPVEIGFEALANEPQFWGWDLRRGCEVSLRRSIDLVSFDENELIINENCPDTRTLSGVGEEQDDLTAKLEIFADTLLLIPEGYTIRADSSENTVFTNETNYLILVQHSGGYGWMTATPQDNQMQFSVYPQSSILNSELSLLEIEPTTHEIVLDGPVGKIAVGLDTLSTDELSKVVIKHSPHDWPSLTINDEYTISEDGSRQIKQFLSGTGFVDSVFLNGQQLVINRWEELAPDVQGAVLGATVAAVISLIGWISSSLIALKRTSENPPVVQVTPVVSPPTINIEERAFSGRVVLLFAVIVASIVVALNRVWPEVFRKE